MRHPVSYETRLIPCTAAQTVRYANPVSSANDWIETRFRLIHRLSGLLLGLIVSGMAIRYHESEPNARG